MLYALLQGLQYLWSNSATDVHRRWVVQGSDDFCDQNEMITLMTTDGHAVFRFPVKSRTTGWQQRQHLKKNGNVLPRSSKPGPGDKTTYSEAMPKFCFPWRRFSRFWFSSWLRPCLDGLLRARCPKGPQVPVPSSRHPLGGQRLHHLCFQAEGIKIIKV